MRPPPPPCSLGSQAPLVERRRLPDGAPFPRTARGWEEGGKGGGSPGVSAAPRRRERAARAQGAARRPSPAGQERPGRASRGTGPRGHQAAADSSGRPSPAAPAHSGFSPAPCSLSGHTDVTGRAGASAFRGGWAGRPLPSRRDLRFHLHEHGNQVTGPCVR